MNRVEHTAVQCAVPARRGSGLVAAALGLALVLTGCGAGQISQTARQVASVNGASGTVGSIAVRDAEFGYPPQEPRRYDTGATVPLLLTIANSGLDADELVSVSGDIGTAVITGTKTIQGGFAIQATAPPVAAPAVSPGAPTSATAPTSAVSPTSVSGATVTLLPSTTAAKPSTAPAPTSGSAGSSAPKVGVIQIVFAKITGTVVPGKTIKLTFVFAKAGTVEIDVPVANPAES